MKTLRFLAAAGLAAGLTAGALADTVVYDQMTNEPNTSWSVPSGGGSTASTGNRFMGVPVNLGGGFDPSQQITGFDTTLINNTGASFTFQPGWQVALNYWIWNSWDATATTTPAFSNLAGSGSTAFTFNAATTLASNSFFFFTQNAAVGTVPPVAGTLPGVPISPVTVSSSGPIGVTLNWTLNRQDGNGFVLVGGLSQVIVGGATALPPSVGANAFGGANLGYYRSASAESNGNFLGSSARNIGANSGLMTRIYVPAPSSLALLGLGGLAAARRRRA